MTNPTTPAAKHWMVPEHVLVITLIDWINPAYSYVVFTSSTLWRCQDHPDYSLSDIIYPWMSALNLIHGVRECFRRRFHHSSSHLFADACLWWQDWGWCLISGSLTARLTLYLTPLPRHTSVSHTHTQTHTVQTDSNACIQAELR